MRYMHTFKTSALFALAECMRVSQEKKTGRFWASVSIFSSLFWDNYVQHKCWQFVQGMYKSVPIEVFSDKQKSLRRLAVELYAHIQILLPCLQLQSVWVLQEIKTCQLSASFSIFDGNSFWGNLMVSTLSTKLDYNVTVPLTTVVIGMLLFLASSPVLGVSRIFYEQILLRYVQICSS